MQEAREVVIFWIFGSKKARENHRLNSRIKKLQKYQSRIELSGCHGDADLRAKEEKLAGIRQEILDLSLKRESLWAGNQLHPAPPKRKKKKKGKEKEEES